MVEKLSVVIALEGGKELERQLTDIGTAGRDAFNEIKKSADEVGGFKNLKTDEVKAGLKAMGITGVEALDKITQAVSSARRIESLVDIVRKIESGFASLAAGAVSFARALPAIGTVAATVFGALAKLALDAAEAISKADAEAIKLGMSI